MMDPFHCPKREGILFHNYNATTSHEPSYFEKYVLFFLNPIQYGMGQIQMKEYHDVVCQYHHQQNGVGFILYHHLLRDFHYQACLYEGLSVE